MDWRPVGPARGGTGRRVRRAQRPAVADGAARAADGRGISERVVHLHNRPWHRHSFVSTGDRPHEGRAAPGCSGTHSTARRIEVAETTHKADAGQQVGKAGSGQPRCVNRQRPPPRRPTSPAPLRSRQGPAPRPAGRSARRAARGGTEGPRTPWPGSLRRRPASAADRRLSDQQRPTEQRCQGGQHRSRRDPGGHGSADSHGAVRRHCADQTPRRRDRSVCSRWSGSSRSFSERNLVTAFSPCTRANDDASSTASFA
jgi:hypothetical protein